MDDCGNKYDVAGQQMIEWRHTVQDQRFLGLVQIELRRKADAEDENVLSTILFDPGIGEFGNDVIFKGWTENPGYTVEDAGSGVSVGTIRNRIVDLVPTWDTDVIDADAEGGSAFTYTYYAMLFNAYHVSYYDKSPAENQKGAVLGVNEVLLRHDSSSTQTEYTVNMGYSPDSTHNFEGWNVTAGGENISGYTAGDTYQNGDVINISGNVEFTVIAPDGVLFLCDELVPIVFGKREGR